MAKPKFKKGEKVDFERNSATKKKNATIIAVLETPTFSGMIPTEMEQTYIVEHADGWTPNAQRIKQFGLKATKTYLFVKESELN